MFNNLCIQFIWLICLPNTNILINRFSFSIVTVKRKYISKVFMR